MWGVDPDRVGMLDFSASAFVSLVTTEDADAADRPSFVAPVYPAWWGARGARAGGAVEAHAYARGGHGFGSRPQGTPSDDWFEAFARGLTASGF